MPRMRILFYLNALSSSARTRSVAALGRAPLRALKFSRPEAFQAQRWAALCRSRSSGRAGWPGSSVRMEVVTVLRMTVSSSLRSCAAAAATAQMRSVLVRAFHNSE